MCAVTFFSGVVVDVVTELARQSALSELLYADDLVLLSETIEGLRNKFLEWQKAFDTTGLKGDLWKTKLTHVGSAD